MNRLTGWLGQIWWCPPGIPMLIDIYLTRAGRELRKAMKEYRRELRKGE